MAEHQHDRKVPLSLELGYKLNLYATYFESIQGRTINAEHWPGTLQYVKDELEVVNEYWLFLFGCPVDRQTDLATQDGIRECLAALLRIGKAKVHVRHGDPVEAAFELGNFFALNDLAPPEESIRDRFLGVVRDLIDRLGMKKGPLDSSLPDLVDEDVEKRVCARKEIFMSIEHLFGEKVRTSWLTGLELAAGIPGVVQLKKAWI